MMTTGLCIKYFYWQTYNKEAYKWRRRLVLSNASYKPCIFLATSTVSMQNLKDTSVHIYTDVFIY